MYVDLAYEEHLPWGCCDDGVWYGRYLESYRQVEVLWSGFVRNSIESGSTTSGGTRSRGSVLAVR